jgi:hypothetical protein
VSLTAPAGCDRLRHDGGVTTADDDTGVAGVQFKLDGATSATRTRRPYQVD